MPCCGCWSNGKQRHRTDNEEKGNPRNKCALQPGHSLMDWIRLGNSGRDLTGVGGGLRAVTPAQLAARNTRDNAWLGIRGRVYNVTYYLPYHPGGEEELMKGVGTDATQLFDKVHPWVNYESLLSKCLIGPLQNEQPDPQLLLGESPPKNDKLQPSKAQELVRKSMENLANCITPVRKRISKGEESLKSESSPSKIMQGLMHTTELPVTIGRAAAASTGSDGTSKDAEEKDGEKEGDSASKDKENKDAEREVKDAVVSKTQTPKKAPRLRYDWIQTSSKLTLCIYTRPLENPGAGAHARADGALQTLVTCAGARVLMRLVPERELEYPVALRVFPESGKVEVSAKKRENAVWTNVGKAHWLDEACGAGRRACRVRGVSRVTHDTVLLELEARAREDPARPEALHVPVGHHVKVHCQIDGEEIVRSYTPICPHWSGKEHQRPAYQDDISPRLFLLVKNYKLGLLTPLLTSKGVDDFIEISGPYGNFRLDQLRRTRRAYLMAAGTGITPILGLITFLLTRRNPKCDLVQLIFFNKNEVDIILRDKLEALAESDERLLLAYILSEPSPQWIGERGRVSLDNIHRIIPPDSLICTEVCEHFAAACGHPEFTRAVHRIVRRKGMESTCFHGFVG